MPHNPLQSTQKPQRYVLGDDMKKLIISFLFIFFSSNSSAMEYFDKELILKHKISYFEERVGVYGSEESCLVYFYRFNERGLLEEEGLQRMSTTYGV